MPEVVMIDGKPAVHISAAESNTIGLANYSSIKIGPIVVSRYVADGDDEHILSEIKNTARILEEFIAEERERLLDVVKT